jgi:transcriptional regulator with XRE-family HTH domain
MPKDVVPDNGIVLSFLRRGQGWSQARLAKTSGTSPTLLNEYEQGKKTLLMKRLEHLVSFMGVKPEAIDATLERLAANRAAVTSELPDTQRLVEETVARVGRLASELGRAVLSALAVAGIAIQERAKAALLWEALEKYEPGQRIVLVEENPKFRSWAFSELVAAKSIEMAPSSPAQALELAGLALRIAELCPCGELLRQRTEGYAWFHVANSRRVVNDLRGSDLALATAAKLWEAGAPGDPGYFNEAIVLGLEATIRKSQRRFPQALRRIGEALAADPGDLRGRLLLLKAQILGALGEIEASADVLRESIPHIDESREPRTALGVRFQFLVCLCLQGRAEEAVPGLAAVRGLVEKLDQAMDAVRLEWLEGKIAAGTGRAEEAEEAFEQVRRKFASHEPPLAFNHSLVSMDLALLLLEQDRTSEARILAGQMRWIFSSQDVHREALAALRVFCEAAKRETATVELARRVIRFLHRSEHDPELKFDETGEAGVM